MQLDENTFPISVWSQIAALLETKKSYTCLLKPAMWTDVGFPTTVKSGHKIEARVRKINVVIR